MKLLRFLQEGEIRPVGENRAEKVDVRVVAATLRDLGKLVEKGEFREDLYYRLNVVNLTLPPLRERREDVAAARAGLPAPLQPRAQPRDAGDRLRARRREALLTAYAWPGNVRELENAIERAVLLAEGTLVAPESLPERLWAAPPRSPAGPRPGRASARSDLSLKRAMRELEEPTSGRRCGAPGATAPAPPSCWRSATGRSSTRSRSTASTPMRRASRDEALAGPECPGRTTYPSKTHQTGDVRADPTN